MKQFSKFLCILSIAIILVSCKKDKKTDESPFIQPDGGRYSEIFTGGQFHLGPVDWEETQWHNAFSPYPAEIQRIEGNLLSGLELSHTQNGELCDACIQVETETGKSAILRVVTYGVTSNNSIDVSPEAYNLLNSGEYPRAMSWYITKCPPNGENIYYQFKTGSNQWWTSFWVRNPSLPIKHVDLKNSNHANWFRLTRISDGSFTDANGFGSSEFTIKITAIDGTQIEDTYQSFTPGGLVKSSGQF